MIIIRQRSLPMSAAALQGRLMVCHNGFVTLLSFLMGHYTSNKCLALDRPPGSVALVQVDGVVPSPTFPNVSAGLLPWMFWWDAVCFPRTLQLSSHKVPISSRHLLTYSPLGLGLAERERNTFWLSTHKWIVLLLVPLSRRAVNPSLIAWISPSSMSNRFPMLQLPSKTVCCHLSWTLIQCDALAVIACSFFKPSIYWRMETCRCLTVQMMSLQPSISLVSVEMHVSPKIGRSCTIRSPIGVGPVYLCTWRRVGGQCAGVQSVSQPVVG